MNKKQSWMYTAIGALVLSIVSLLMPVMTYQSGKTGVITKYNIFKLINSEELNEYVFTEYRGEFLYGMSDSATSFWVVVCCLIGITAIILAFVGIKSMAKQYESARPFRLAILGLIGTALPSIVLLILYFVSKNQYLGTMHLGAYIIITPIAMIIACLTVTSKYRMSKEEAAAQAEARKYIRPAGDLSVKSQRGNQYYGG